MPTIKSCRRYMHYKLWLIKCMPCIHLFYIFSVYLIRYPSTDVWILVLHRFGPFLFLAHRTDFGFTVLDVVMDDSSTLIVLDLTWHTQKSTISHVKSTLLTMTTSSTMKPKSVRWARNKEGLDVGSDFTNRAICLRIQSSKN